MRFFLPVAIFILTSLSSVSQETIHWSADTIKIYENYIVPENTSLLIDPGVIVEFYGNYKIEIAGSIKAMGNINDSILFTVSDTTGFTDCRTDTTYYDTIIQTPDGGWGGINITNNSTDTSIFKYCRFQYAKKINSSGGGLFISNYNSIIISNCLFSDNYVHINGAGVYANEVESLEIRQNTFSKCRAHNEGGGIFIKASKAIIDNNLFINNHAYNVSQDGFYEWWWAAGSGSGVHSAPMPSGYPIITNNYFANNTALDGTLYEAGNKAVIYNNVIVNNLGLGYRHGSGFQETYFINNTVVNNYFYIVEHNGIASYSPNGHIFNNIIWNNTSSLVQNSSTDYSYNNVDGGLIGEGNINEAPIFTNPSEGIGIEYDGLNADWTLLNFSPCINKGTPDTTGLNLPQYDIAGNPRVFGGRIDMGAYENQNVYVKINDSPVYSKIKLYPNPGTDKIYIDIPPEMDGAWIDIVDGQGRVLMHEQISFSPSILSPYKLQSGIYFYRIYNENKVVKSGKWVKR